MTLVLSEGKGQSYLSLFLPHLIARSHKLGLSCQVVWVLRIFAYLSLGQGEKTVPPVSAPHMLPLTPTPVHPHTHVHTHMHRHFLPCATTCPYMDIHSYFPTHRHMVNPPHAHICRLLTTLPYTHQYPPPNTPRYSPNTNINLPFHFFCSGLLISEPASQDPALIPSSGVGAL